MIGQSGQRLAVSGGGCLKEHQTWGQVLDTICTVTHLLPLEMKDQTASMAPILS